MRTRNIFSIPTIEIDLSKYEELTKIETKYNQLFEWQHKHGNDEILQTIDNKKYGELFDTKEVVKEFHVGQKVKLVKLGNFTRFFKVGEIVTIDDLQEDDSEECIKIISQNDTVTFGYVSAEQIEAINEGEEN